MLFISSIPAFYDNYIWIIENENKHCYIVDPGDAKPVLERLKRDNLHLDAILITHHHRDHTDGLETLLAHFPNSRVYGPSLTDISLINHTLCDGEHFTIYNISFTIHCIPGHTRDHICYYNNEMLFCGDTLFSGGCGRLFEGTPEQMYNSLSLLASFPNETKVFCAHEYTLSNLAFAQTVEPDNTELQLYVKKVNALRKKGENSLPSTIGIEKAINPFLRTHQPSVKRAVNTTTDSDLETFTALRRWKDEF